MTHQKNDTQDENESQVSEDRDAARALAASRQDRAHQRAGGGSRGLHWSGTLPAESSSDETIAMDIIPEVWTPPLDILTTCQCRVLVEGLRLSSLSAIIAAEAMWIRPLERCLLEE